MRFAYEPIPILQSPANPPAVESTAGLGTGGGAGIFSPAPSSGTGRIEIVTGAAPLANGNVHLVFAIAPPTLFFGASEVFGTLTEANQGTTDITVAWSGASLLPNKRYQISYEWAVSK